LLIGVSISSCTAEDRIDGLHSVNKVNGTDGQDGTDGADGQNGALNWVNGFNCDTTVIQADHTWGMFI